jgi:haloalkane dehalogenase
MHVRSQGDGYPVLFLHGIPTRSRLWNGIVEKMSGQFKCIAVDLPGLGRTPAHRSRFRNPEALAGAVEELRIRLKIDQWHIAGHDAGCAIAVHYARQFPEHVGRLALLTPSMFPELKPFCLFEPLRIPVMGELLAPLINLLFWRIVMRLVMRGNRDMCEAVSDFEAPFAGIRGSWRLMSLLRWGKPSEVLSSIPRLLPGIAAPTLVFHGSKDPAVPEAFARRASEMIPHSRLVLLNAGHFLPLQEPGRIAQELQRFFYREESTELQAIAASAAFGD